MILVLCPFLLQPDAVKQDQPHMPVVSGKKELHDPRVSNRGVINLCYTMEGSLGVIDMLRNEKPIFLHFDPAPEEPQAFLSTSLEPIGEGE